MQYEKGYLRWPKTFSTACRDRFPVTLPPSIRRADSEVLRALYSIPSLFKRRHDVTRLYTVDIGYGLFSRIQYAKGEKIAEFVGEMIDFPTAIQRKAAKVGQYIIHFSSTKYMDCYQNRLNNLCLASCANSALNCCDLYRPCN